MLHDLQEDRSMYDWMGDTVQFNAQLLVGKYQTTQSLSIDLLWGQKYLIPKGGADLMPARFAGLNNFQIKWWIILIK